MTRIKEDARRNCRRTLTMMLNFEVKLVPRGTKVLQIFHVKAGIHTGKMENGKWVQWRRLLIRANMALFLSQSQIRTVGCTAAAATVPTFPPGLPPWQSSLRDPRSLFRVVQKVSARFCELATMLGVNSRNLEDTFLINPVLKIQPFFANRPTFQRAILIWLIARLIAGKYQVAP